MSHELESAATQLESLMATVMRAIYQQDPLDPLTEFSVAQLRMLRLLAHGPRTPSHLGEELGLSVSAVTQMANRLEAAGILARSEDKIDRRIKHVSLTDKGTQLMDMRRHRRIAQSKEALSRLSPAHRRHLMEALQSLAAAMGKQDGSQPLNFVAELEHRLPPAS